MVHTFMWGGRGTRTISLLPQLKLGREGFLLFGHWVLLWRPITMAGDSGPPEEEQVERATPRGNPLMDEDPIGREAWLVVLKGAVEARESSIDEESIEPALELLMKTWLWPSPGKLPRAFFTVEFSTINDWGLRDQGPSPDSGQHSTGRSIDGL